MGVARIHARITADISRNSTSLPVHDVCPVPTRFVIKVNLHFLHLSVDIQDTLIAS